MLKDRCKSFLASVLFGQFLITISEKSPAVTYILSKSNDVLGVISEIDL